MPVEVVKTRSFKAFAGEYVMIVLSIVTALALENGVRSYNQSREAQQAVRNLDIEIAANIAEMRSVIAQNTEQVEKIKRLKTIVLADIKAGVSDKETVKHMMLESGKRFDLSLVTPSLQREAWDVAMANQALSFMPAQQLQPYARQYANMRDTQAMLAGSANTFLDLSQLSDMFSDMQLNELTGRDLYRVLTQMGSVYESNGNALLALEALLVKEQRHSLALAKR